MGVDPCRARDVQAPRETSAAVAEAEFYRARCFCHILSHPTQSPADRRWPAGGSPDTSGVRTAADGRAARPHGKVGPFDDRHHLVDAGILDELVGEGHFRVTHVQPDRDAAWRSIFPACW